MITPGGGVTPKRGPRAATEGPPDVLAAWAVEGEGCGPWIVSVRSIGARIEMPGTRLMWGAYRNRMTAAWGDRPLGVAVASDIEAWSTLSARWATA